MVLYGFLEYFLHGAGASRRVNDASFGNCQDAILADAKGGIIYSPGSAGTMQEIFQEAVQNHYLSFGYASPMIFMNKQYWTEDMPVYLLMEHLVKTGKYKNMLMSLTDSTDEIVKTILEFRQK